MSLIDLLLYYRISMQIEDIPKDKLSLKYNQRSSNLDTIRRVTSL